MTILRMASFEPSSSNRFLVSSRHLDDNIAEQVVQPSSGGRYKQDDTKLTDPSLNSNGAHSQRGATNRMDPIEESGPQGETMTRSNSQEGYSDVHCDPMSKQPALGQICR